MHIVIEQVRGGRVGNKMSVLRYLAQTRLSWSHGRLTTMLESTATRLLRLEAQRDVDSGYVARTTFSLSQKCMFRMSGKRDNSCQEGTSGAV